MKSKTKTEKVKTTEEISKELQVITNKLYERAMAGDKVAIVIIAEIAKAGFSALLDVMIRRITQPDEPSESA